MLEALVGVLLRLGLGDGRGDTAGTAGVGLAGL